MEANEARDRAIAEVERIAKLNGEGFVARTYDLSRDEVVWCFGSLKIGLGWHGTDDVTEYFKLGKDDDRIDWTSFKAFLLQRKR